MAFTKYQILLSILMVATGSINTLSTKWADNLKAFGSDGVYRKFDHPLVQGCVMFFGEFLCLLTFKFLYFFYSRRQVVIEDVNFVRGNRDFSCFIFLAPAILDMIGTSMMYVGLTLTYASSFQMLRGSSIVFVALLSSTFVGREIGGLRHWSGIGMIVTGLALVGLSDLTGSSDSASFDTNSVITGDLLIIMAQILAACQMVYEEKYVVTKDIAPLQAVGFEGLFGFIVLSTLLIPAYWIRVGSPFSYNPNGSLEDVSDAFSQMTNNPLIIVASLGTMISIAFFNFAGISMTKEVSATTRIVLDSVRTFFIWMFSLMVGWQKFHFLQLIGFQILFGGMCLYYNILPKTNPLVEIRRQYLGRYNSSNNDEQQRGSDRDAIIVNQPADQA